VIEPAYRDELATLYLGNAFKVLRALPAESVDAVVTDPPAGISFMRHQWDTFRWREAYVDWLAGAMAECWRVLKPGAHALVWAIPGTSHWAADALETAGFEIRPEGFVLHLFGQGLPKSRSLRDIGRPELGTGLKPAVEVWWLARKPLSEPNVARNVQVHGTGALNVDGCRVRNGLPEAAPHLAVVGEHRDPAGRWPANLTLSHGPGCVPVGMRRVPTGTAVRRRGVAGGHVYSETRWAHAPGTPDMTYGDGDGLETVEAWECEAGCPVAELDRQSGIAGSRFFYVAKASTADRNAGLVRGRNRHPTVKPVELMRHLVRLVTPPSGLILDCFAGTGSTLVAAKLEGLRAIGVERDPESVAVCVRRLAWATHQPELTEALP
jgi:site-specific DNA-methyltransferase (adenine-specific)